VLPVSVLPESETANDACENKDGLLVLAFQESE
jgi:hypothetical protein